jgi:hypothetical protein
VDDDVDEEDDEEANNSPDTSSIFDTSANDASWATAATDMASADLLPHLPVVPLLPPPQQQSRRSLTREQAREKAEILRLRLGLASYKLRTGQTSVPLADLQLKPLPPRVRVQGPERAHAEARTADEEQEPQTKDEQDHEAGKDGSQGGGDEEDKDAAPDAPSLPRVSPSKAVATPRRTQLLAVDDEDAARLTSSALRGGAANGLLSLARSAAKQV